MRTIDVHGNTRDSVFKELEIAIKQNEKIIKVITGYGSNTNGVAKIKNQLIKHLCELKDKKIIKGYLLGSDISDLNSNYIDLITAYPKIADILKNAEKNQGILYIIR